MKTRHLSAAALAVGVAVFSAHQARADEGVPTAQGARFSTTAPDAVVAAAACSMHAVLSVEGRPRALDVQFDGRRCSMAAVTSDSITVDVYAGGKFVLVQTAVPDLSNEVTGPIVIAFARELRSRVESAIAPQPPALSTRFVEGAPSDRGTKLYSPTMVGVAATSMVVGGLMMFGGSVGALSNIGTYGDKGNLASGLAWLGAGTLLAVGVGVPLLAVGCRKVPRVVAGVSPTGGSLRVSF